MTTLREMSYEYQRSAEKLRLRIKALRKAAKETEDPELKQRIDRRIKDLRPLLQETRELTVLTRRYYDRRYYRNEKYTL